MPIHIRSKLEFVPSVHVSVWGEKKTGGKALRAKERTNNKLSVKAGVYSSQTSVLSFHQEFSCFPNWLIVCNNCDVSTNQVLTVLRILTCIDYIYKTLFKVVSQKTNYFFKTYCLHCSVRKISSVPFPFFWDCSLPLFSILFLSLIAEEFKLSMGTGGGYIQGSHSLEKSSNSIFPWKVFTFLCKSLTSPQIFFNFQRGCMESVF